LGINEEPRGCLAVEAKGRGLQGLGAFRSRPSEEGTDYDDHCGHFLTNGPHL
jgi:hypothetical protein